MKFTYPAPIEIYVPSSGFRTIESDYFGPHDLKVFVDAKTRKFVHGVQYDHDGHPEIHDGSDPSDGVDHMEMVYLHSHNPNHIVLMAMITNHEDHKAPTVAQVIDEKYNMVWQQWDPMPLDDVYDLRDTTIDANGIVTYHLKTLDMTWASLVANGMSHAALIKNVLNTNPFLTEDQIAKGNKCIEVINYIIKNEISKDTPWKITWPDMNNITLDNSVPIGVPDGIPNPDKDHPRTEVWGAVPHEPAYHMDGDDVVVEGVCPTTAEDAAKLQPWTELTEDHPTHSESVKTFEQVQQSLIDKDPNIHLTTDIVQAAYNDYLAQQAASNAPATPAP